MSDASGGPRGLKAKWVDTPEGLATVARSVAGAPWVALDTEFIRERTYYGHLCLLQIGWADGIALVDTISLTDLSPLVAVFEDSATTKILHASVQDMELFLERFDTLPTPVFDTQVASSFLGHGEQIGYADLVCGLLGVSLDKGPSRTDWARRPLSDRQLMYAADDVRYLGEVYTLLRDDLKAKGREDWLTEPFADLERPGRYVVVPEEAYTRVKGIHRLDEPAFRTAVRLAMWREARAQHADRPRQWVLKDPLLVTLAKLRPRTDEELMRVQGMSEGIPTSTLASRDDLERLAGGMEVPRLVSSWRKPLLADRLRALLEGRVSLTVVDGVLQERPCGPSDSA
jgi:ribonuclease D